MTMGLGDSEDISPYVPDTPKSTTCLNKLPDLSEYRAKDTSPKEEVAVLGLEDSELISDVPNSPNFISQLPDLSE